MSKSKSLLTVFVVLLALPMLAFGQKTSKIPTISSLSPNTKTAGAGSFTITVTGANFTSGTIVKWNGTALTTTYISSTQLQAAVLGTMDASAGTAKVTTYTSGRWYGTSNSLNFTIAAPATTTTTTTTTTTSTSPLSITTTSVPSATAGTAVNSSFAGTGGTPAYTWSLASGSTPPPGLVLASTGTLSGTPTTAGTYSFTVQAADSASTKQTAQKVFSMSVASAPAPPPPPTSGGFLFSDDFEGGNFSKWSSVTNPPPNAYGEVTITSASGQVIAGGNAAKMTFFDNSAVVAHKDIDRYPTKLFDPGYIPDHFFIRSYVKLHVNSGTAGMGVQRKMIYLNPTIPNSWAMTLGTDPSGHYWYLLHANGLHNANAECDTRTNRKGVAIYPSGVGTFDSVQYLPVLDQWYYFEVEAQLNSAGNANGYEKVWVQAIGVDPSPILILQTYNVDIRGSFGTSLTRFDLGEQVDWSSGQIIDEERYIDNFAISTSYIGP